MTVRVLLAGTVESLRRISAEPERRGIELRVLTGEDEAGNDALGSECMGDGSLLDGFGPCADDQSNIYAAQLPP